MSDQNAREAARERMGEIATDDAILWGVVANVPRVKTNPLPRWTRVQEATGNGSTVCRLLCIRCGFDPDEQI